MIKILEFIAKFLTLNLLLILNEKSFFDLKLVFIRLNNGYFDLIILSNPGLKEELSLLKLPSKK